MKQKNDFNILCPLYTEFFVGKMPFGAGKSVRFTECPLYKCPPYRGFIMRVWPKNIPFQRKVSVLKRCPLLPDSTVTKDHALVRNLFFICKWGGLWVNFSYKICKIISWKLYMISIVHYWLLIKKGIYS